RPRPIAIGCGRGCITSTSSGWTCWSWPPACRTPPRSPRNTKCRRWKQPSASFVTRRSIRSRDCSRITGGCVSTLPWFGKRKEGWFTDMFTAGFEGEDLPADERWRAIQWLGERTAKDPRFAVAMTEHVYYLLTGRKVLLPPKDFEDPLYGARLRAFREQRNLTEAIAGRFAKTGFNLKAVFKDWILSDFYHADALATAVREPCRQAEFDDIGLVRMLSPEQLERKVAAVFGEKWNRLDGEMAMLYGGIDSKEVTDRATDPSGAIGPPAPPTPAARWARFSASSQTMWRAGTWAGISASPRMSAGCSRASSRMCCRALRKRATRRSARRSRFCTRKCWGDMTRSIPPRSIARSRCSRRLSPTRKDVRGSSSRRRGRAGKAIRRRRSTSTTPSARGVRW